MLVGPHVSVESSEISSTTDLVNVYDVMLMLWIELQHVRGVTVAKTLMPEKFYPINVDGETFENLVETS